MEMASSNAATALSLFIGLTLVLVIIQVGYRALLGFSGKTPFNSWTRDAETWNDAPLMTRMKHAHLNCLENLLLFAALFVLALAVGKLAVLEGLALWFIGLRFLQTAIHLVGTSPMLVFARANAFIAQLAIMVYWLFTLCCNA